MNKTKLTLIGATSLFLLALACFPFIHQAQNQQGQPGRPAPTPTPTPTLGLERGYLEFDTPDFTLKLVKASQTIAACYNPKAVRALTSHPLIAWNGAPATGITILAI